MTSCCRGTTLREIFSLGNTIWSLFSNTLFKFKETDKVLGAYLKNYGFSAHFRDVRAISNLAKKALSSAECAFRLKFKKFDQTACFSIVFFTLRITDEPLLGIFTPINYK